MGGASQVKRNRDSRITRAAKTTGTSKVDGHRQESGAEDSQGKARLTLVETVRV